LKIHINHYRNYEIKMPYYFVSSDITPDNILGSIIKEQLGLYSSPYLYQIP